MPYTIDHKEIEVYLGYGVVPCVQLTERLEERAELVEPLYNIVQELNSIDEQLNQARADSMAQQVDDLKVDYHKHVAHLRAEGSRLLRQMSALLDYPMLFDKYTGRYATANQSSVSVVSYW